MVKINLDWNKENLGEFVRFSTALKTKSQVFLMVAFYAVIVLIIILCAIMFALTGEIFAVISACVSVVVALVYNIGFRVVRKNLVNNLLEMNLKAGFVYAEIDTEEIILSDSEGPVGKISWSTVAKIEKNTDAGAVYITTEENAMLLFEYKNIIEGTKEALDGIFEGINGKLPKEA